MLQVASDTRKRALTRPQAPTHMYSEIHCCSQSSRATTVGTLRPSSRPRPEIPPLPQATRPEIGVHGPADRVPFLASPSIHVRASNPSNRPAPPVRTHCARARKPVDRVLDAHLSESESFIQPLCYAHPCIKDIWIQLRSGRPLLCPDIWCVSQTPHTLSKTSVSSAH